MMEQIDERFEQIDERFEQISKEMDERFEQVHKNFEQLNHEIAEEIRDFSILVSKKQREKFQILDKKLNNTNEQLKSQKEGLKNGFQVLTKAVS
mgnify:CR=1 FL=1